MEYFKHKNESIKTMNNYTQFFDKYIEAKKISKPSYGKNTIKVVNQYLKNNGYQITDSNVISGCKAIFDGLGKNYDSHSSNYGVSPTDTTRINNILTKAFPPKQNTIQNVEQQTQPQTNPQRTGNINPQNTGNSNQDQPQQPQDPKGNGSKTPEDNPPKSDLPQDDPMNDLAGITMLTKDELRAMVNKGPLSKIMANLMKGKLSKESKSINPETKISNIQISPHSFLQGL